VARRVRVLRVIARLNAGGPAHHVGILSSRLDRRGYETLLAHGDVGGEERPLAGFDERYPARRVRVADLGPELDARSDARALRALATLVRSFRPDIVHTHTAKAGVLGRLAVAAAPGRPVVAHTYHGHVLEGYFGTARSGAYRVVERRLARRSDCLIGVSEQTVADLVRLGIAGREKFRCVRLGLDLDQLLEVDDGAGAAVRRELAVGAGELLLVTIGRLVPIKRLDVTLLAVAHARRLGVPARLAVVGAGPLRGLLEVQARALGLEAAVTFTGARADIAAVAAAADAMILSSDNEGTPVALIEGAAAGRPALATRVGGVPDVVTDGTGRLVGAGDWRALGEAIAALAGDPAGRAAMGAAARRHVAARYRSERLLDDIDDVYRSLLAAR
jgi:glycosyltransferase involved in cell wall biosynthesis